MEVEIARSGEVVRLRLGGRLTVASAGACRDAFLEAAGGSRRLEVEFGEVATADLAVLQLLCAAHRSMSAAGGTVALLGAVPGALAELAERAGAARCSEGPPGCLMLALRRAWASGR